MKITVTGDKVVMEMTMAEAKAIEHATMSASWYWSGETQKVETKEAKEAMSRISMKYKELRGDIADIIGY
jgi:hypothetical protein